MQNPKPPSLLYLSAVAAIRCGTFLSPNDLTGNSSHLGYMHSLPQTCFRPTWPLFQNIPIQSKFWTRLAKQLESSIPFGYTMRCRVAGTPYWFSVGLPMHSAISAKAVAMRLRSAGCRSIRFAAAEVRRLPYPRLMLSIHRKLLERIFPASMRREGRL